jgi:hypothetical protein
MALKIVLSYLLLPRQRLAYTAKPLAAFETPQGSVNAVVGTITALGVREHQQHFAFYEVW